VITTWIVVVITMICGPCNRHKDADDIPAGI
jgi:hypothetical protein